MTLRGKGMAPKQPWESFGVRIGLLIVFGICATSVLSGNSGREFVFAPVANHIYFNTSESIGVVLQGESDENITVNIQVCGISLDVNITLLSGSGPYDYPLPNSLIYRNVSGKINSTVVITSDSNIFVLAYNIYNRSSDTFSVIPKQYLGHEYFIATMTRENNYDGGKGFISISALEQNTYVEIYLRSSVEFENDQFYAGDIIRYSLLPYETIQLLPQFINITGSRVLANASLAVSVGSKCANVPANVSACDHIAEQIAPFTAWGKVYVISPLASRTAGYLLQVIAGRDNTTVSYDDVVVKLNMGDYETVDIQTQEMLVVSADKPISIMQYSPGLYRDHRLGDPSMIRAIPIEQYVMMATFPVYEFSPTITYVRSYYLGITSRCEYMENITALMDGIPVRFEPMWTYMANNTVDVLNVGTKYCTRWAEGSHGTYTLRSQRIMTDDGHDFYPRFSAIVYGTGYRESYLYRAASDDRTLTRVDYRPTLNDTDHDRD